MKLHFTSNGKARGLSPLRSVLDFFFPFGAGVIRCEAASLKTSTGKVRRDFYTFRAFATHYVSVPLLFFKDAVQGFADVLGLDRKFAWKIGAAIAYDTATEKGVNGTTSLTLSHTVTGSNPLIFAGTEGSTGSSELITGCTYAGVTVTKIDGSKTNLSRWDASWLLAGPSTGANNFVVSASSSDLINLCITSYSGCLQTGQPDNHTFNSSAGTTSLTTSLTTTANNCWLVGLGQTNSAPSAGTGTTQRITNTDLDVGMGIYDSNGAKTPAGSYSLILNQGSSVGIGMFMVSIAPFLPSKSLSETITVSDTLIRTLSRTLTQSNPITDVIQTVKVRFIQLAETLSITDALSRLITRTLTEASSITDSMVRTTGRALSETISIVDTALANIVHHITFLESFTIVDRLRSLLNGLDARYKKKYPKVETTFTKKYPDGS